MSEPAILYGLGATKAGTSWLYQHLHDHPDCALRAVKEAHYWDTFEDGARETQLVAFAERLSEMRAGLAEARAAGVDWKVRNHLRRIEDMERLIAALSQNRTEDARYIGWLMRGAGQARLVADITPGYAALDPEILARMRDLGPRTRFLYLLRDPVDRLWSHARMHAARALEAGGDLVRAAHGVLSRVITGQEPHIARMSDYRGTVERLEAAVPAQRRMVMFSDEMFSAAGVSRLSGFLGIADLPGPAGRVNESVALSMDESVLPRVAEYLKDQYEWVARHMGPVPPRWQHNLQRAMA